MTQSFPAPVPRVPWSRRDAHLRMGHPTPPKRASAGVVVSTERDTVTVLISDEELPGVVPLGDMPQPGDLVEVESRGMLLVIPLFTPGVGLGGWYFTKAESPGWHEDWQEPNTETGDQRGEHVWHSSPSSPGILWNESVLDVSPDDKLTFKADLDQITPSITATVQFVVNWAAVNAEPHPGNGEVIAYGATKTVNGEDLPFERTVTVPDTFDKPPNGKTLVVGSARIGLKLTPGGEVQ